MANTPSEDGPITVIVSLKIKPDSAARALELWHEQIADIHATEPPGNIQYSFLRDNKAENEYTVVAT
jgi:quinol monooxygenase YgiN